MLEATLQKRGIYVIRLHLPIADLPKSLVAWHLGSLDLDLLQFVPPTKSVVYLLPVCLLISLNFELV